MAKDKDRSVNPAAAALKSQKQREIKKGKAQTAQQRTEKLARRNPERLQKQVDELRTQRDAQGGKLRPKDQQTLEQLERDVRLVRKAREQQGAGQQQRRGERSDEARQNNLGKRRWNERDAKSGHGEVESEETETDEDVRAVPMPGDTPPPVPPRYMQRKLRKGLVSEEEAFKARERREQEAQKPKSPPQAKAVYSAAPQLRNLEKEAIRKFMPAAVAARHRENKSLADAKEGKGNRLLEPEELEALEQKDAQQTATRHEVAEEAEREGKAVDKWAEEERRLMMELGGAAVDGAEKDAVEAIEEIGSSSGAEQDEQHSGEVDAVNNHSKYVEVEEVEDEEKGGKRQEIQEDSFW